MVRIHIRSMNINSYGKNSLAQCCFTWCSVFLEPIKTAKSEMPVLNKYKSNTLPLKQLSCHKETFYKESKGPQGVRTCKDIMLISLTLS